MAIMPSPYSVPRGTPVSDETERLKQEVLASESQARQQYERGREAYQMFEASFNEFRRLHPDYVYNEQTVGALLDRLEPGRFPSPDDWHNAHALSVYQGAYPSAPPPTPEEMPLDQLRAEIQPEPAMGELWNMPMDQLRAAATGEPAPAPAIDPEALDGLRAQVGDAAFTGESA